MTCVAVVDRIGGAERSLIDLVSALDRERFHALAVVPREGELSRALEEAGAAVTLCPSLRRLHRRGPLARKGRELVALWRGARELAVALEAQRSSVVHANGTEAALFAVRAARRRRVPLVWHLRDMTPLGWLGPFLGRRCARLVVPSCAAAAVARGWVPASKLLRVASGIDTARFGAALPREEARRRLGLAGGPLLASIGAFVPWKGFERLVEAASRVHARRPDARFALLGDERFADGRGTRAAIEELVRVRGLSEIVRLVGHVDNVPLWLSASDALVHPAFPEPFGRVVAEAMAAGRAVVCLAGEHGPAELVRDGVDGLHAPASPEGLAEAVLELLADLARCRAMGEAGRRRAAEAFDRSVTTAPLQVLFATLSGA